jgi:hypothetical protein
MTRELLFEHLYRLYDEKGESGVIDLVSAAGRWCATAEKRGATVETHVIFDPGVHAARPADPTAGVLR